jgi:hypothetical protein
MLYGAQIWGVRNDGDPAAPTLLQPLRTLQNRCLRNVTGAYRRTSTAALERETDISPINLYINKVAAQHAITTRHYPASQDMTKTADGIWTSLTHQPATGSHTARRRSRERPRKVVLRPPGPIKALCAKAAIREQQIRHLTHPNPRT